MEATDVDDLRKNSALFVTFTVSKYSTQAQRSRGLPAGCSLNIKEIIVLAMAEEDGDIVKEFREPEPHGLDLRRYTQLEHFEYKAPVPKQSDKEKIKKEMEAAKREVRAAKAKKASN
jgi:hypothetical protein